MIVFDKFVSFIDPALIGLGLNCSSKSKRDKFPPVSFKELVLNLDPLQAKSMQKTFHRVHTHNNTECDIEKEIHPNYYDEDVSRFDSTANGLLQKHFRQLSMGQG